MGVGIHIPEFKINISKRSDQLSVYTAEIVAAIIALQWVEAVRPGWYYAVHRLVNSRLVQSMASVREDLLIELHHC